MFPYAHIVNELIKYKKGEVIPDPDSFVYLNIKFKKKEVVITRRSIAHILQKKKVGIILINLITDCISKYTIVFISNKGGHHENSRYILLGTKLNKEKHSAVVIEYDEIGSCYFVVTAMVSKEKYLSRKYKKLR